MRLFVGLVIIGWVWPGPLLADTQASDPREVKILVEETSLVKGADIFLGDIALIQASPFLKKVLEKMVLGNAPNPGKIKQLSQRRLLSQIHSQQGLPEDALIDIPEKVYVKRTSQQIKQAAIHEQVDIFFAAFFKGKDYELEWLKIKERGLYPEGVVTLSIESKSHVNEKGTLSVFMDILIDGKKEDSLRISGKVAVYEDIFCAARTLAKGEVVLEKDVYFARKEIFGLQGDVVRDVRELTGKSLKTSVQKDDYIQSEWLEEVPLIQKGALVTLVARKNNVLIVTSGISKEDGYADKLI
jgi:flagella basal body P-ring formation protein FlgA